MLQLPLSRLSLLQLLLLRICCCLSAVEDAELVLLADMLRRILGWSSLDGFLAF